MVIQRKKTFFTIFPLAAVLALLPLFQVSTQAGSEGDQAAKNLLDNVVQLNVKFSDGSSEHGFGFVVGERNELLYVVTADHVVRSDEPDVQTTNIEAKFYSDKGDPEKAKLLQLSAGQADLALLEIPKPFTGYRWEANCISSPRQDSKVWFIGRDQEWWVPADIEAGIIKDPPIYPTFKIRINSVQVGTSGAPLISKEGIIGMIVADDTKGTADALNIETIQKIITLKWNYPWGLKGESEKPAPPKPSPSGSKPGKESGDMPADVLDIKERGYEVVKNQKGYWEADFGDEIIMIYIPAGEFTMGSNGRREDEKPGHKVHLDGYWIGKYEVTFAQYDKYCESTGKKKPDDKGWGREQLPVVNVSWYDCVAYRDWFSKKTGLSFQLPTEAQWEKAARGADGRLYPWGDSAIAGDKANFSDKNTDFKWSDKSIDDGYRYTAPVGSFPGGASPYGCLDMAGNVFEWCVDWYAEHYYKESPPRDPQGPAEGTLRVARGGSWFSNSHHCRSSSRRKAGPDDQSQVAGFRLAGTFMLREEEKKEKK